MDSGLARSYKQPISIEFRDAPLKQVFEIISRRSGLNFVFDKDVKTDQKATVLLKNSTVESAIYFLLLINQLEQEVMDANTILIYSASKSAAWAFTNALRIELRAQSTVVLGLHVSFIDTDLTKGFDMKKSSPQAVVQAALEGLERNAEGVLADAFTLSVKQSLSADQPYYLDPPEIA